MAEASTSAASTSAPAIIDASPAITARKAKTAPQTQEPLQYDLGLLAVFDHSPLDTQAYADNREAFLLANAREGMQGLINALWERPTTVSDEGVMASLPEMETVLPREKPLPKAKIDTKWQQFAKSKGIAPKPKRDRMVYDEEKQDWVPRWGYKGKNKDAEEQWLVEVPVNAKDQTADPRKKSAEERKERTSKNAKQQLANISRAQAKAAKSGRSRRH